jgi:hypoxanthine-DNA glycosylase
MQHPFEQVFDTKSRVLILGTFPSVKSREHGFYYGHPQNRFWKIIAIITSSEIPETISAKKQLLLTKEIALADVLQSCFQEGSQDSRIKNAVPANLEKILNSVNICQIYANGDKAYQIFMKFFSKTLQRKILKLPSSSPANAKYSLEKLVEEWSKIIL